MTLYERKMAEARENDKVVYYDYLAYKRAAGWWTGFTNDDWNRPQTIKRAKYHAGFLQNLPEYYFLGFPIKELLKTCYSDGYCHACAIALSLYFDDFTIITCNLKTYAEHYSEKSGSKMDDFKHTFIVVSIDCRQIVIDTSFGIITDYDTYKNIFNIDKIKKISSEDLRKTKIYQFIEKRKKIIGPSYESELHKTDEYKEYESSIHKYMNMCKYYFNPINPYLQSFISRCLFRTSNSSCIHDWRTKNEFKSLIDCKIQYPTTDLYSLQCDEFDTLLDSRCENTKARNAKILENYHREKSGNEQLLVQNIKYKKM